MRTEQMRVQPDTANPLAHQSGVLSGRHAASRPTARKKVVSGLLRGTYQIVVDCLPSCFGELEPYWPTRFFLTDGRSVDRVSTRCNIFDLQSDNVAPA